MTSLYRLPVSDVVYHHDSRGGASPDALLIDVLVDSVGLPYYVETSTVHVNRPRAEVR